MINRRRLILFYTIQQVIPNICTKFQNPRFSSSWENLHTHTHTHTHTQTNIVTEKTKSIYPLYTSYTGGITKLYRQIIGIPMDTNYAPLVEDLFLFCYERDFMKSLSPENQADIIEAFNCTSRYLEIFGCETTRSKNSPGVKHPDPKRSGAKRPGPKRPGLKCPGAKRPGPKSPGAEKFLKLICHLLWWNCDG